MNHVISDLEQLGLNAARQIAGDDAVEAVEVADDWNDLEDRPAYRFTFLIDHARSKQRPGLVFIRTLQKLREDLTERGDEHELAVTLLDRTDWDKRTRA